MEICAKHSWVRKIGKFESKSLGYNRHQLDFENHEAASKAVEKYKKNSFFKITNLSKCVSEIHAKEKSKEVFVVQSCECLYIWNIDTKTQVPNCLSLVTAKAIRDLYGLTCMTSSGPDEVITFQYRLQVEGLLNDATCESFAIPNTFLG